MYVYNYLKLFFFISEFCLSIALTKKQINTFMNIQDKSNLLLMLSFEYVNNINCYGYCPQKNNSLPYQKAKRRVLKNTLKNNDIEIYNYIKENL